MGAPRISKLAYEAMVLRGIREQLASASRAGWRINAPKRAGRYERMTALGVKIDLWDGRCWRRALPRIVIGDPFEGIICANQVMPWREVQMLGAS